MAFNAAAVSALIDSLVSTALELGVFRSVNFHEPKAAPVGRHSNSKEGLGRQNSPGIQRFGL